MKRFAASCAIAVVLAAARAAAAEPAPVATTLPGVWHGELPGKKADEKLRLVLDVTRESGSYVARIHSMDQNNAEYVVQLVRVTARRVELFLMLAIDASYDGTLSDDGAEISGVWTQKGMKVPLVFRRAPDP